MLAVLKHAPRGWNSWDCYGASVTEEVVRQNAAYMAAHMKQAGYEYVCVDIQWYEPFASSNDYRPFADLCIDEYGRVIPAENRFPSSKGGKGFAPLAEYIHSLGLKLGIHIMRGIPRQAVYQNTPVKGTDFTARQIAKTASTCWWNTDMYGVDTTKEGGKAYYASLLELYASWGVDYIKIDDICRELPKEEQELIDFAHALAEEARPMVLSLSPGPALLEKAELYKQLANMWRITDDFWDRWDLLYAMFERAEKWSIHAGNSHYPDADMLPVGAIRQCYDPDARTKFTRDEQKTMMILWCIMRAPLIAGNELTKTDDFTLKLLTDVGLMDMHENSRHAHQVFRRVMGQNEICLWVASCAKGGAYVAAFNLSDTDCAVSIRLSELEWEGAVQAEEIYTREGLTFRDSMELDLPSHGARAFHFASLQEVMS